MKLRREFRGEKNDEIIFISSPLLPWHHSTDTPARRYSGASCSMARQWIFRLGQLRISTHFFAKFVVSMPRACQSAAIMPAAHCFALLLHLLIPIPRSRVATVSCGREACRYRLNHRVASPASCHGSRASGFTTSDRPAPKSSRSASRMNRQRRPSVITIRVAEARTLEPTLNSLRKASRPVFLN